MADRVDQALKSARTFPPRFPGTETGIQIEWNSDIERAALAAARGDRVEADDYAQQVRIRVLAALRSHPDAPPPYIRTVISNTLKDARRQGANPFSSRSPLAEPLDENVAAPVSIGDHEQDARIAGWVSTLPLPMRRLYQHLYSDNLSQREAARLLNISQPRVAQIHTQLLKRGRKELTHLAA